MGKYLKLFKNGNRSYWWLIESYREGSKVTHKKLRYWGVKKPGEDYQKIIMPLDDGGPLDDLWVIWQAETNRWHGWRRRDFMFWFKQDKEEVFWRSFKKGIEGINNKSGSEIWLTRAPNRSQAIKNVKEKLAINIVRWIAPWIVLSRMTGSG
jgi:hypothetical protein